MLPSSLETWVEPTPETSCKSAAPQTMTCLQFRAGWCGGTVQLKRDGTQWRTGGKWRGNWRMEWVASTLHTTSEHGVSRITTDDAHTSAASSRLNWRPCRFKWTRPFRRKTKSAFCACAIAFQTQFNNLLLVFGRSPFRISATTPDRGVLWLSSVCLGKYRDSVSD